MSEDNLRVPPHNLKAEQALIGALLIDTEAFDRIADIVDTSDFYHKAHRTIFTAIVALQANKIPSDVVTVAEKLEREGNLEDAGGLKFLGELTTLSISRNVVGYARVVADVSIRRRLLSAVSDIADMVHNPNGAGTDEVLNEAQRMILSIEHDTGGPVHIQDAMKKFIELVDKNSEKGGDLIGLPTGFADVDLATNGLQQGELIVLGARSSMGKSTLAMNIAENVYVRGNGKVLVFSLEMRQEALAGRMLAGHVGVSFGKLSSGRLDSDEWQRFSAGTNLLCDGFLWIDDTPGLSLMKIASRSRRMHRECKGLDLVVIDYLQLVNVPGIKADNKYAQVSEISAGLKALAMDLNIPVLALAQLNRQAADGAPRLHHLKDSGSIEQDADMVLLLHRDKDNEEDNTAFLDIAKQRNGMTGAIPLVFFKERMRFESKAEDF